MGPTDEELVAAFRQGDAAAFDVLVGRWDRRIHGAIYRVVGADDEARDLCQEAFLKAYRGLGTFKMEARFSSWLYQIAINVCRDRLRRRRGKIAVSLDEIEDARAGGHAPHLESGAGAREHAGARRPAKDLRPHDGPCLAHR